MVDTGHVTWILASDWLILQVGRVWTASSRLWGDTRVTRISANKRLNFPFFAFIKIHSEQIVLVNISQESTRTIVIQQHFPIFSCGCCQRLVDQWLICLLWYHSRSFIIIMSILKILSYLLFIYQGYYYVGLVKWPILVYDSKTLSPCQTITQHSHLTENVIQKKVNSAGSSQS